jgi:hypothetical protein
VARLGSCVWAAGKRYGRTGSCAAGDRDHSAERGSPQCVSEGAGLPNDRP